MNTTNAPTKQRQPATAEELLDHEEALAIRRLASSVERLGDDLCIAADLRPRIRRHPFIATGLAAIAGFVGAPLVLRTLGRVPTMGTSLANFALRRNHSLPALVLTSLRAVRARP
jgi:hypothetical protein